MLTIKLKKVVEEVVSNSKSAFLECRQILGVVLIANEAIDSMMKSFYNIFYLFFNFFLFNGNLTLRRTMTMVHLSTSFKVQGVEVKGSSFSLFIRFGDEYS